MKGWCCLFIILVILVGFTISRSEDKLDIYSLLNSPISWPSGYTIDKKWDGTIHWSEFSIQYNEKGKYLEIIGKNIHLRIYECGKVEKLEWKELNPNEDINGRFYLMQDNMTPWAKMPH